ncbi:aromatase/cyclase [Kutzneria buriramensis]|uniref:Aromatase n=1 Tax=Kutzneria buriramensis TaxID=1045776 RepID=A0A3E0GYD7_9PSEU|nr:aromatase/cyclase [Kutzneria buriramensis]REH32560.1 aromatase [Kutzneria buriramensis]
METLRERDVEHGIAVAAPAAAVYDLVRDVTRWPVIFAPTVHVRHLARDERGERFQIWAVAGDGVLTWTSRREFEPSAVAFRQERSQPPVASMGGRWEFRDSAEGSEVLLRHRFAATEEEAVGWIEQTLDRNSEAELAGLRRIAELGVPLDQACFTFEDSVEIAGSAADAYRFIDEADRWPDLLPHVRRVDLVETAPGIQRLEMDTVTKDGDTHTTSSVRVCFPDELIVYKQVLPPALLIGHSGQWSFRPTATGATVTATHTVLIDPAAVAGVLGASATLQDARAFARKALGGNSLTTLAHAKEFAEAAR